MSSKDHMDYRPPEHLKFKGNATRLGDKSDNCLELRDLFVISTRGFTPKQFAHAEKCEGCRMAYRHYMKLRRAYARQQLELSMKGVPLPDMDRLK